MLASVVGPAVAQPASNEAEVKAAFVYNFLKFVDWPPRSLPQLDRPLRIAIVGEGAVADATASLLQGKRVSVHPTARRTSEARGAGLRRARGVHHRRRHKEAQRTLESMASAPVLTISDDAQFASRGGMIGLYVEDRRVRFEVNTDATDARGLRVSSRLLALARLVRSGANGEGARP